MTKENKSRKEVREEKSNFSIVSAANLIVAVLAAFYFSSGRLLLLGPVPDVAASEYIELENGVIFALRRVLSEIRPF